MKGKVLLYIYTCCCIKRGRERNIWIEQLIERDVKYDLLNGNAGAVQALLLLYEINQDKTYLEMAELQRICWKSQQKNKNGELVG